ncbi:MAG: protein-L-isoaspartate O-methyltransferase [Magnetospirillum sp. WYHS-4]
MDYAAARRYMVESQLRTNRVNDPLILAAMAAVPREAFAPESAKALAYRDEALPLGHGRFLMEPLALARLLQAAGIRETDVVLEVGCGTGYGAAVIARIANAVVALESDPALAALAGRILADQHAASIVVAEGPLESGYPRQAPYDVIVMGGAVADIPRAIQEQLAEGGRLVAIQQQGVGKGILLSRHGSTFARRELFELGAPPLPGFAQKAAFVF